MKGWLLIQPCDEYLAATNQSDATQLHGTADLNISAPLR
jgi:hypothetical protein